MIKLGDELAIRPSHTTFNEREVLAAGSEKYLLSMPTYSPEVHGEFKALIQGRIRIEIRYESLYGGDAFQEVLTPTPSADDRPPTG
ncbi:hypothetical protein [Streptomyces noursei]|uniref:hypothetical protein n=1 Tax=Streptomyces noursei TaxID=1971 RepID=UPI0035D840FE